MTSNIGSQIIQDNFEHIAESEIDKIVEKTKVAVLQLLRKTVRPEFLNRIDETIMFKPLMKTEIKDIILIQLQHLQQVVNESGIKLSFTEYAIDYLVDNGYDPQLGARPLKRLIQKSIINQLSKRILAGDIDKSQPVLVDVFDGLVVFRNENSDSENVKIISL